jgi:hypothetical protein
VADLGGVALFFFVDAAGFLGEGFLFVATGFVIGALCAPVFVTMRKAGTLALLLLLLLLLMLLLAGEGVLAFFLGAGLGGISINSSYFFSALFYESEHAGPPWVLNRIGPEAHGVH